MAGLLDQFFGNADQTRALGLLGAGMMSGGFAQGAPMAMNYLAQAPERQLKQQYLLAQMQNLQSEVAQRNAALETAKRKRESFPSLFTGGGLTGGEPVPQAEGNIPMFSRPMGVTPVQAQPRSLNVDAAVQAGYTLDEIPKLDALRNIGLNKVARTVKAIGPDGREYEYQMDDFGRPVGAPLAQYRAPISVNRGNSTEFLDAYSLQPKARFQTFQSPDSAASVAATLRGQNMTDARAREANALGRVPAGYRQAAGGNLEFIPGGPADPNAAKKAAPTEFQGKSAIYGTRAQEADKIISSLDGKYSPAAVNTKLAAENAPWYMGGGVAGTVGNMLLSKEGQQAEQAQRDFINAVLRQESGAVISPQEFDNARKQYFPQPFDSAAVKAQKAANRKLAIHGILNNARSSGGGEPSQPATPSVDDLLKKYGGK